MLAFLLGTFFLHAQDWNLLVTGKVYRSDGSKLDGAVVSVLKNGSQSNQIITQKNGKFDFVLDPEANYIISVSKAGYATKRFQVDTRNVPSDRGKSGNFNPFAPEVTLRETPKNASIASQMEDILREPLAKYSYSSKEENFVDDPAYTRSMLDKLAKLKDLEEKAKEDEKKKAQEIAMQLASEKALNDKYNQAIARGTAAMGIKDWNNARSAFTEATGLKPAEQLPKDKLKEIDQYLRYSDAIGRADKYFASKDWTNAKAAYTEALGVQPAEQYPKDQIAKCDKNIADEKARAELEAKYKQLVAKADAQLGNKSYVDAKVTYTEALGVKPEEQYPKDKIAEINKILKDMEDAKAKDQQYNDIIGKADLAFSNKKYTDSRGLYQQALGLKPEQQHPKDRIAEIDKILAGLKDQEEKDRKYNEIIAKADASFNTKTYPDAKSLYTSALGLKPDEKYPKDQLAKIDKILADLEADKAKRQQYNDLVQKADVQFNAKEYVNARALYSQASALISSEQYPKDQIAKIDKLLDDEKNRQLKDKQYNDLITKADGLFNGKKWNEAKPVYQQALDIKPNEKYPKDKLDEIEKMLALDKEKLERDKKYADALAKADAAFKAKTYPDAKTLYQGASAIKPEEQYPKDQIAKIDDILAKDAADKDRLKKQRELDDKYNAAIAEADKAFTAKDWDNAKGGYNKALGFKPEQQYPKDQLARIEKLIAEDKDKAEKEKQYRDLITKADAAFDGKKYADAKPLYVQASELKPAEKYPKDRIAEIDKLLLSEKELAAREQQYKDLIAKADAAFNEKKWTEARPLYASAGKLKPEEKYPPDRIAEIDAILGKEKSEKDKLEKQKALDAQYAGYIAKADAAFNAKKYSEAKPFYEQASNIKPDEKYPKDRIAEIEKLLAATAMDDKYKALIAKADKKLADKDYYAARSGYNDALGVKPNEQYPKDKLAEIEKILHEMASKDSASKALNEKYNAAILKADYSFSAKKYDDAKTNYNLALSFKPNEQYPKDKLNEIEKILKDMELVKQQNQLDAAYNQAIARGDKAFGMKDYGKAKIAYKEALSYKSAEQYPKDQLKKIEELESMANNVVQKDPEVIKKEREKYQSELMAKYGPNDNIVVLPQESKPGYKVIQIVVVKNGEANMYKKIVWDWGGVYYKKNDSDISQAIFENDTGSSSQ